MTDNSYLSISDRPNPDSSFHNWCRSISSLFDAELLDVNDAASCQPSFTAYNVGGFVLVSVSAPSAVLRRDTERVTFAGVDHLLLNLIVSGECMFDADGRSDRLSPGDILFIDLSRRITSIVPISTTMLALIVPRHRIRLPPNAIDTAHGAVIRVGSAMGQLLGHQISAFGAAVPQYSDLEAVSVSEIADALVTVGVSLAIRNKDVPELRALPSTIQNIRSYIEAHLSHASLTPDTIGRHFGLSRSALYRLFRSSGGIAGYIRERRMQKALLHISSMRQGRGSVGKLARLCGFTSDAAFTTSFRRRFGMPPNRAIAERDGLRHAFNSAQHSELLDWLRSLSTFDS